MLYEKKDFTAQDSGGDFDSAPKDVSPNSWINSENVRTLTTDSGEVGNIESIGSTILINNPLLPAGDNIEIGHAIDQAQSRVAYFIWNSNGNHAIFLFDAVSNLIYLVLSNSQVTGGFNFDKNHLIHSTRIINGCVYWTDNLNEPKRINIDAGVAANLVFSSGAHFVTPNRLFTFSIAGIPFNSALKMTHVGLFGTFVDNVSLDWSNFGNITSQQIIANGIINYFTANGITTGYSVTILPNNNIVLSLGLSFTWPSGGSSINTFTVILQFSPPNVVAYIFPVSQSVISWIRRQPGLPPVAAKKIAPGYVINNIALLAVQFSYRYTYRQYELSTLSSRSNTIDYNTPTDSFNYIDVNIPFTEKIDQDVLMVDMVVQFLDTNGFFIIKTWDKNNPDDATEILNHNAGTTPLTYSFYYNSLGISLDSAYVTKPFDSVPIYSQTIEMAKNRSFMGNYTIGYTAPVKTSLQLTLNNGGGGGAVTGRWAFLAYQTICGSVVDNWSTYLFDLTDIPASLPHGFYYWLGSPDYPPGPATVDYTLLSFAGAGISDVVNSKFPSCSAHPTSFYYTGDISPVINVPAGPVGYGNNVFKSDGTYKAAVTFYDYAGRKCGIVTNSILNVTIPDRTYTDIDGIIGINWTLNNTNALAEIPQWAYYFSIDLTLVLRTRFFLQGRAVPAVSGTPVISYVTKDVAGNYVLTNTTYSVSDFGIAIDITCLSNFSMGYAFSDGDIIKLYISGATQIYSFKLLDQFSNYVICQAAQIGTLDISTKVLFEIYTPYKPLPNEPYYEISQIFTIANATTNTRSYGSVAGTIPGDTFIVQRNDGTSNYYVEAMSPNDKFYQNWWTNAGRPNFKDTIGQVVKYDTIAFSNTIILGSESNGLSTYDALDTKDVFPECGPIQKLQLTSKVEGQQGGIMLSICSEETASLYLSETQMVSADANQFVAQSTGVIGTVNVLKGSFGTVNPESVVEFRGNVYWVDVNNGKVIQYSSNGLFPISSYKMTRFWNLFCLQYGSMSENQIEALGSRPFIFTSVDPQNWELLVSIPKVLSTPPKGYLPDYPETIYPFDIWDGQAKTIVFKLSAQPNHWSGSYRHTPEGMFYIQNQVFGFKNGQLWQHNSIDDFSVTIYGVVYKARIMFLSNSNPKRPKVYNNFSVEGNLIPSLTYFRTEPSLAEYNQYDLNEQASDLMNFDFEVKEGQLYSVIYRNKLVPTQWGLSLNGLLTAEKIRALFLKVMLEFTPPEDSQLELRYVNMGLQISGGHST